jgi:hypothetical protein
MTLRRLCSVLAAAPVVGCFLTTEPADSVDVQVSVTATTFHIGDTVRVTITLTNRRSDAVEIQTQCGVWFAVFDGSGRGVVPRGGTPCALEPVTISLASREEKHWHYPWFGEPWNGTYPDGPYPTEYLDPGSYTVRGVLELLSWPDGSRRQLSPPVPVQLLPPREPAGGHSIRG